LAVSLFFLEAFLEAVPPPAAGNLARESFPDVFFACVPDVGAAAAAPPAR
jgi:hypothetical protein